MAEDKKDTAQTVGRKPGPEKRTPAQADPSAQQIFDAAADQVAGDGPSGGAPADTASTTTEAAPANGGGE